MLAIWTCQLEAVKCFLCEKVSMYRPMHGIYRVWDSPWFQASSGDLGMYPLRGTTVVAWGVRA